MLLSCYLIFSTSSTYTNQITAGLALAFSLLLCYKARKSIPIFIASLFILYCNYSVVVGEYFTGGELGATFNQTKTTEIYGITIKILLLFISILSVFYNAKKTELEAFVINHKNNALIYYSLLAVLLYIFLFGVKRGNYSSYEVSVTPLYEYSTLLFLICYYTSGGIKLRKYIIVVFCLLFIIQDFYYGGRITSMQLIILLLMTIFLKRLKLKLVIMGAIVGIVLNSFVDVYRQNYSLKSTYLLDIIASLFNNYFVFNTPVFAFYSSSTHVATSQIIGFHDKAISLLQFIISIFIGSSKNMGNVTYYSKQHFFNIGGGFLPSHFYFWLSWSGVIIAAIIMVLIFNAVGKGKSDFWRLATVCLIYSLPRWYLYTPLSLIRPILLLCILYLIYFIVNQILQNVSDAPKVRYRSHKF